NRNVERWKRGSERRPGKPTALPVGTGWGGAAALDKGFQRAGPGLRREKVRGSRGRTTRTNRRWVLDAVRRRVPHPTLSPDAGQGPGGDSLSETLAGSDEA